MGRFEKRQRGGNDEIIDFKFLIISFIFQIIK